MLQKPLTKWDVRWGPGGPGCPQQVVATSFMIGEITSRAGWPKKTLYFMSP